MTAPPVASLLVAPIVRKRFRPLEGDRKILVPALLLRALMLAVLLGRGRRDRKGLSGADVDEIDVNEETRNDGDVADNGSWEGKLLLLLLLLAAAAVPAPRRGRIR